MQQNSLSIALRKIPAILVFCVVWGLSGPAFAQLSSDVASLQGHERIFVAVSTPNTDVATQDLGLRKESLEKYILKRLEKAGVDASTTFTDQTLILEVNVDLIKVVESDGVRIHAFVSNFEAVQATVLAKSRRTSLATTWKSHKFGAITKEQSKLLRESVVKNLDNFIKAWEEAQADSGEK